MGMSPSPSQWFTPLHNINIFKRSQTQLTTVNLTFNSHSEQTESS